MDQKKIYRRHILVGLLVSVLSYLLLPWKKIWWAIQSEPQLTFDHELQSFLKLSSFLIDIPQDQINVITATQIWNEIILDKNLKKEILIIAEHTHLLKTKKDIKDFQALQKILTAWYTGVWKSLDGTTKRLFYDEALMHSLFTHIRPAPGNCYGAFGYWSEKPEERT